MHDICKSTGLSLAWNKRNLASLRKKGIIERMGANKNGYWIVNI
jgi:predicted HTH transcriptional regulator